MAKLWRSTFVFSAMTMLSRVMGLIRDIVMMNVFGASALMDAFLVAFKIPSYFRRLFAEGAFSQAFVPVLTEYKTKRKLAEVQFLISCASGSLLVVLTILTAIVMTASPAVIMLFASGFEGEKFTTAVELLRITFPYLLFISMTAFAGSVLNSYNHFATPAFAPVLLNISFIVAALFVAPMLDESIKALGWAVFVAGILQFAIQIPALWHRKLLVPPRIGFKHEGVRRIMKLMLPALFGVSVTQLNLLLNTVFASYMQDGSVAWLYTAERMSELPLGIIGVAIGTVILPSLSAQQANQDEAAFKRTLDWAAKVIILIGVPASVALFMLSDTIMQAIFMQGKFTLRDAQMSGYALKALAGGVLAFMLIKIFAPGFFAKQDTKTPVKVGIIAVITNIVLSIVFIALFKYVLDIEALHAALALASSSAALVNAGLLYYFLQKDDHFKFGAHWRKLFAQYGVANLAMIAVLAVVIPLFPSDSAQVIRVMYLIGFCLLGAAAYGITLLLTGFRPHQLKPS